MKDGYIIVCEFLGYRQREGLRKNTRSFRYKNPGRIYYFREDYEMSEKKKARSHALTDRHPYIASVLMGIVMWLIGSFGTILINMLIHLVFKDYPVEAGPVGILAGSVAAFAFYKFWFRPEFEGHLKGGNMKAGFRIAVPYIVYLIFSFVLDAFFAPNYVFRIIPLDMLLRALVAGFIEECIFRGGMLTTLTRRMPGPKRILPAVLFSSAVFGIVHMTNINSGYSVVQASVQSVNAFTTGIVDALIFLVSGNAWTTILLHVLHDIIAFSFENPAGFVVNWETWLNFVLCTALGVHSIVMLRKPEIQKHILKMWAKKWNEPAEAEGSTQYTEQA